MTKQCKAVLKQLVKLSNSTDAVMGFVWNHPHISLAYDTNKFYDYSSYAKEIKGIIQQLIADGYLELAGHGQDFKLTHKGLHRKAFQWIEFKHFLLNSIFVPIVVSLLTALITLWLQAPPEPPSPH